MIVIWVSLLNVIFCLFIVFICFYLMLNKYARKGLTIENQILNLHYQNLNWPISESKFSSSLSSSGSHPFNLCTVLMRFSSMLSKFESKSIQKN